MNGVKGTPEHLNTNPPERIQGRNRPSALSPTAMSSRLYPGEFLTPVHRVTARPRPFHIIVLRCGVSAGRRKGRVPRHRGTVRLLGLLLVTFSCACVCVCSVCVVLRGVS